MRCRPATILTTLSLWIAAGAHPASAGPWAREKGEAFLAFAVFGDAQATALMVGDAVLDRYASLYGEYGLGHRMTLGAHLGRSDTAQDAVVFLRYTITASQAPWQIALDGGVGLGTETGVADRRLLRLGFSVGRGFGGIGAPRWWLPLQHNGGWVALDVTGLLDIETEETIWQAEGTLGLSLSDRLNVLLLVKSEEWPGSDPAHTLTPGAAWALTDRATAHVGLRMGIAEDPILGLTLGLWHSF
jgi:hypothetical protein